MAQIRVERTHDKPLRTARAAVERVAKQMAERFDVDYEWDGSTLHFRRSGVDGRIELGRNKVVVVARLGLLLSALRGSVENAIHEYIDREFG
ncbi:MAG: hypothetical protein KatS3mg126_2438 [Lysobacteraceae bacterium]|nr:MAG: hypothetical protein KatS3mg126_2438 [Xanthomonadaceae bacterium]